MRARKSEKAGAVVGIGASVVAVACCVGIPALGAAIGGLTVAAVLGVGGGSLLVAAAVIGGVLFVRARRRRACSVETERDRSA